MKSPYELTERELSIFHDMEFMPLKARVWVKIEALLSQLQQQLQEKIPEFEKRLPRDLIYSSGKLSKGENYNTYSYRVMDYPRLFQGNDIFTFRCVALWGHPIGFHLILKGQYKESFQEELLENIRGFPFPLWLSDQNDPWIWEPEFSEFVEVNQSSREELLEFIKQKPFLKLSYFLPLENYLQIPEKGLQLWNLFWQ